MSLEECKRIAEKRLRRARVYAEAKEASRYAEGIVEDGRVEIDFYADHIGMSFQTWIVAVFSYKHCARSKKTFELRRKKQAGEYFEELVQEYGLKEEEK